MGNIKRCIFLAGAPRNEALSWDEDDLRNHFDLSVRRFLGTQHISAHQAVTPTPYAKWRSVDCNAAIVPFSTRHQGPHKHKATLFDSSLNASEHFEYVDFVEHSIALLEDIDTSQIIPTTAAGDGDDTTEFPTATDLSFAATSCTDTSTHITNDSFATASPTQADPDPTTLQIPGGITHLRALPKADHIARIHPQTITVNLLIGIIAISPSRIVRLRRPRRAQDAERDIIELTVGDETRAGFSISFWLTPQQQRGTNAPANNPNHDLRTRLHHLRPGHVVLLQNVAVSSWKGNVYGQSLSRRFARNETRITAFTALRDTSRLGLPSQVVEKVRKVREWTGDFVGLERRASGGRAWEDDAEGSGARKKRRVEELQLLPPDTQD